MALVAFVQKLFKYTNGLYSSKLKIAVNSSSAFSSTAPDRYVPIDLSRITKEASSADVFYVASS